MTAPKPGLSFLPWFPSSFLSSTRGWSVTARGIYRELLDSQWESSNGLPANATDLQRMIGATPSEWRCWPSHVELKFPLDSDGRRRNPTLERHREKSLWIRERNSAGGIKGNAKRWAGKKVIAVPNGGARRE